MGVDVGQPKVQTTVDFIAFPCAGSILASFSDKTYCLPLFSDYVIG